jgi:hypothetical protein
MRLRVVCALLLLCGGCVGHGQDAHEPGDRLGTYHVSGQLQNDTCQAAVLGVTSQWQFDVKLSRESDTLYWLNGQEAIPGTIAQDGRTFDFESGVEVSLQPARGAATPCVIERSDTASGKLSSSTTDVSTFELEMNFGYAVSAGSGLACAGVVSEAGGFAALPCQVSYALNGARTALPPRLD